MSSSEIDQVTKKAANDYSKYLDVDVATKLQPVDELVEGMLARLEEFESLISFTNEDVNKSTECVSSLTLFNGQLQELCSKIDTVEKLVDHIKGNLRSLEEEIEKAETKLKLNNDKGLVSILNPILFRKIPDRKHTGNNLPIFDPARYFNDEGLEELPDE